MALHSIQIEETDYEYLKRSAGAAGISIETFMKQLIAEQQRLTPRATGEPSPDQEPSQRRSRWARFSEQVRKNPPLHGVGEYVRECSREFREDFALTQDGGG